MVAFIDRLDSLPLCPLRDACVEVLSSCRRVLYPVSPCFASCCVSYGVGPGRARVTTFGPDLGRSVELRRCASLREVWWCGSAPGGLAAVKLRARVLAHPHDRCPGAGGRGSGTRLIMMYFFCIVIEYDILLFCYFVGPGRAGEAGLHGHRHRTYDTASLYIAWVSSAGRPPSHAPWHAEAKGSRIETLLGHASERERRTDARARQ